MLETTTLPIPEVRVFKSKVYNDNRGTFEELFSNNKLATIGLDVSFVQSNRSYSLRQNTLRGLHYQSPPYAQGKLVRCETGAIYDVAVDIRKGSPYYGSWVGVDLRSNDGKSLYIPPGFAHGFVTKEADTVVTYMCTEHYYPESEGSIVWDDATLSIDWGLSSKPTISQKDSQAPFFNELNSPFVFGENS